MVSLGIDVIIPMYNAADHIEECLDHVFASEYQNFRVTVVDDQSSDDSLARVGRYPKTKLLALDKNMGASTARNRGVAETTGGIVVFIDSDVLIPKDFLARVAEFFTTRPEVAAIQGRYEDRPYYKNLFSQYKHFVFSFRGVNPSQHGEQYVDYVHTACVAVRRKVFSDVAFNEQLSRCEDIDFGQRCTFAGYKIFADPTLAVGHKKKYTFLSYTMYQFRAARDMVLNSLSKRSANAQITYYSKKSPLYKKLWLMRPLVGFAFLFALVVVVLKGYDFAWLLLALLIVASFVFEVPFRVYLLKNAPIWISIAAWPLYFLDGITTGMGVIQGVLTFRRPE